MPTRRIPGNTHLAVAYLRVSTEDQNLGPEAQRRAIEAWAVREGVTVAAWFEDHGVCGATELEDRPGLGAALADLRVRHAGVLAIAKRDRLARDVVVAGMIDRAVSRYGACVVAADGVGNGDSPADGFMRTILDGAAQYERALIRARTRSALAVKRDRGEFTGGEAPYGLASDAEGKLVACEVEQAIRAEARELRSAGVSLRGIVARLAERGVVSRAGKQLALTQVVRMLSR